jgi:hypothetical protein
MAAVEAVDVTGRRLMQLFHHFLNLIIGYGDMMLFMCKTFKNM